MTITVTLTIEVRHVLALAVDPLTENIFYILDLDCDYDDHQIDYNHHCNVNNWGTTCASPGSRPSHWEYFLHSRSRQVRTSIINRKHTIDLICHEFFSVISIDWILGAKTFQVFCQSWTQAAQRSLLKVTNRRSHDHHPLHHHHRCHHPHDDDGGDDDVKVCLGDNVERSCSEAADIIEGGVTRWFSSSSYRMWWFIIDVMILMMIVINENEGYP